MARVIPFIGTRYNPNAIENITDVVAPPYDVISPEQQKAFYDSSPVNIIRLILGVDLPDDDEFNNKYQRAAASLRDWKSDGTLIDDPGKTFYIYQQEYQTPDKVTYVRTGVFAGIRLEMPGKGRVHAHEHTFAGPKADRLKLLRQTGCNLSPIFCMYSDPSKESDAVIEQVTQAGPPRTELTDADNVIHRLWLMTDRAQIKRLSDLLQDKDFFIADGHHRYETALQYYIESKKGQGNDEEEQNNACSYTLSYLTNCEADGLQILPTHRVLSAEMGEDIDQAEILEDLAELFDVEPVDVDLKKADAEGVRLYEKIRASGEKGAAFAMVLPNGKGYFLTLKADAPIREEMPENLHADVAGLDVSVLHEYIIPNIWIGNPEIELDDQDIFYVKDAGAALKMLGAPTFASAVFLMNAPTVEQVQRIGSQNLRMPHKSTYFYPKLLSGMVLRDHSVA